MSSHNTGHVVTRTGFPFSHGRIITSTACQGRTMHEGVVIDCGRLTEGATPKLTWGSAVGILVALIGVLECRATCRVRVVATSGFLVFLGWTTTTGLNFM